MSGRVEFAVESRFSSVELGSSRLISLTSIAVAFATSLADWTKCLLATGLLVLLDASLQALRREEVCFAITVAAERISCWVEFDWVNVEQAILMDWPALMNWVWSTRPLFPAIEVGSETPTRYVAWEAASMSPTIAFATSLTATPNSSCSDFLAWLAIPVMPSPRALDFSMTLSKHS